MHGNLKLMAALALGLSISGAAQADTIVSSPDWLYGPGKAEQIESGLFHNCVLTDCGSIECAGLSWYGQLRTPSSTDFIDVAAGGYHSCGLHADGTAECWGADWYGQATPPSTAFESLEAGWYHTCGTTSDGVVECWGDTSTLLPTSVVGEAVAAGAMDTCSVTLFSLMACEGGGVIDDYAPWYGQNTTRIEQVEISYEHGCVISGGINISTNTTVADRYLTCWGNDTYGQASGSGTFTTTLRSIKNYNFPGTDWTDVDTGAWHTCGIEGDELVCWGADWYGQATPPSGAYLDVSTGYQHSCAIAADGSVDCWGDSYYSQTDPLDLSATCPTLSTTDSDSSYDWWTW